MTPDIYWVHRVAPLRLALMPRPRGDDWLADEVAGWQRQGIGTVVSLLEPLEVRELALQHEASLCATHAITFLSFPIKDRCTPDSMRAAASLVDTLVKQLLDGVAVAVHCRAGIGRSGLISACVLHELGVPAAEIFPALSRSRGLTVPDTGSQIDWLAEYRRFRHAQKHR